MADTTVYLATVGRKVHMEMAWLPGKPACDPRETTKTRIAAFPDGAGQVETLATLTEQNIAPSRLCGHCFTRRLRHIYTAQRLATKTAA